MSSHIFFYFICWGSVCLPLAIVVRGLDRFHGDVLQSSLCLNAGPLVTAAWRWSTSSWINLFAQWSFYPEHFVHLHRHLESVIRLYPGCILHTNKQKEKKIKSLKMTNGCMKWCSAAVENTVTCSYAEVECHLGWPGSSPTAYLLYVIPSMFFILKPISQITHTLTPGWVYLIFLRVQ